MQNCQMCGKKALSFSRKWYKYDNGEQFLATVCLGCSDLHEQIKNK